MAFSQQGFLTCAVKWVRSALCLPGTVETFPSSAQEPGIGAVTPVISCCLSAQGHSSSAAGSSPRRLSPPNRAEPRSVGAELIEWRPCFAESIRNNLILGCGNWQLPQLLSQLLGLIIRLGPMLLFLTCSIYLPGSVHCCSAGAGCATGLESGGYSCPNRGSQDGSVIRAGYSCFLSITCSYF